MAGDWIKFEISTLDKPEVRQMARVLGVKHGEALELLLRFWAWMDANSVDGHVDGLVDKDVDEMMCCQGFSAVMQMVGWLKCDNAALRISIPNADRHNGKSAKKRALSNSSQSKWRSNVDGHVDKQPSTKASTREEKRREDIKASAASENISLTADGWSGVVSTDRIKWGEAYPAVSIDQELAKARAWLDANPKNKKSNYRRFLVNWFCRAQDSARPVPVASRGVYVPSTKVAL
jgi:hypothetical protein